MPPSRRIPLWMKWFVGLFVVLPAVGLVAGRADPELSSPVVGWLVFLACVLFPGRNPHWPRLFVVLAVIWALAIPLTVLVVVMDVTDGGFEQLAVSGAEHGMPLFLLLPLWTLMVCLLVTLYRRHPAFRVCVLLNLAFSAAWSLGWLTRMPAQPAMTLELGLDLLLQVAVAAYLLWKFRPLGTEQDTTFAPSLRLTGRVVDRA